MRSVRSERVAMAGRVCGLALVAIVMAVGGRPCRAQAVATWTGGSGTSPLWSTASNWSTPPLSSGTYTLIFTGTSQTTSFNDAVTVVKANVIGNSAAIQFTNDGTSGKDGQFRLTGGPLTL